MDPSLTTALIGLIVVATTVLQSWYQRWAARADKEEIKTEQKAVAEKTEETAKKLAAKTDTAAQVVTDKLETVHKAVNGEGLGGKLDVLIGKVEIIEKWQAEHDAQDNRRYDETIAHIAGLRKPPSPPDTTPKR